MLGKIKNLNYKRALRYFEFIIISCGDGVQVRYSGASLRNLLDEFRLPHFEINSQGISSFESMHGIVIL